MDYSQKINCTVRSCKYNNGQEQGCELAQIIVTPKTDCATKNPDESMCSSYAITKDQKDTKTQKDW